MTIAVIYWSGTGNTLSMANMLKVAIDAAGGSAKRFTPDEFDVTMIDGYEGFALGCPSMGAEELEDGEFLPFYERIKPNLSGKRVALFGSYGWGDGEWMRNWEQEAQANGLDVVGTVICQEAPDAEAQATLVKLAETLIKR